MHIYLDIDGTLIHEDLTENYGKPAAGLQELIIALRPYDTYWLTTHCMDGNPERARTLVKRHLPPALHPDVDRIKSTKWSMMKTEGIDWSQDFVWLDDNISTTERALFASAPLTQSFITMDLRHNPRQLFDIIKELALPQ